MTDRTHTRRNVLRLGGAALAAAAVGTGTASALPGKPNFSSALYGDGETWGTKGAALLPPPTDNTVQSYDKLFAIVNGASGQLPVAEASPGNPDYNGGRWFTHTVEWTASGMMAHDPIPVLTRYGPASDPESILFHYNLGHLEITAGSPNHPDPPNYFECPMLPDKS